jgi:hypothetical protein
MFRETLDFTTVNRSQYSSSRSQVHKMTVNNGIVTATGYAALLDEPNPHVQGAALKYLDQVWSISTLSGHFVARR